MGKELTQEQANRNIMAGMQKALEGTFGSAQMLYILDNLEDVIRGLRGAIAAGVAASPSGDIGELVLVDAGDNPHLSRPRMGRAFLQSVETGERIDVDGSNTGEA